MKAVSLTKLRHGTALALAGWYLIAPPVKPCPGECGADRQQIDLRAPLSRWQLIESFDSAEICKQYEVELKLTASTNIAWTRAHQSECIASDDPRLKEK
jgi:hypothetical protein